MFFRLLILIYTITIIFISFIYAIEKTSKQQLETTKINKIDNAEMVLVPAGNFIMGTSEEEIQDLIKATPTEKRELFLNEIPQHKVYLDSYYIYKTEVTVAQYQKFCKKTGRKNIFDQRWKGLETCPIFFVSWDDATAYAKWASAKLPSEAQWEKAARGTEGRIFPWGNEWDKKKCVTASSNNYDFKSVGTIPDGASPYGCLDMSGNVWEWCYDWYKEDYYQDLIDKKTTEIIKNPTGPLNGDKHVIKGGSYGDYKYNSRCAYRGYFVLSGEEYIGFRCVVEIK